MRDASVPDSKIQYYRSSGFYAAIYKNDKTGEIIVAYRGTDQARDLLVTDALARASDRIPNTQYAAASDLAMLIRDKYASRSTAPNITLTGHSLGGALATYAGQQQSIQNVYTFNAARNSFSTAGSNPRQVNIVVPGDNVGDANTNVGLISALPGAGRLPGESLYVNSSADQTGAFQGLLGSHDLNGIIGGLSDVARGR